MHARKIQVGDAQSIEVESIQKRAKPFNWDPKNSVGKNIKVFWEAENAWFMGVVKSSSGEKGGMFFVVYEDGDEVRELPMLFNCMSLTKRSVELGEFEER